VLETAECLHLPVEGRVKKEATMRAVTACRSDDGNKNDFPVAYMTPRNLTSRMAGNFLEGVAAEEMQS
jgi:hypothetical protein